MESSSYVESYQQYLQQVCPTLSPGTVSRIETSLHQTDWNTPRSPVDYNNCGVIALIEAESCPVPEMRGMYLDLAIAAFKQGINDDLICAAHLAILYSLIGATQEATQLAFSTLITFSTLIKGLPLFRNPPETGTPWLIYLPELWQDRRFEGNSHPLTRILELENPHQQGVWMLLEVLWRSQLVFYGSLGLRFLQLATHLGSASAALNLRLGISHLLNAQEEGLFYLQ
jgi:hypothetical protein